MIYVLLAEGFEETEAIEPIDIMKRAGLGVTLVSLGEIYVTGAHGITVKTDINIDEVIKTDIELLMLPGGAGHVLLDRDERVHELIDYVYKNDLYLTAICASPSILGKRGLLRGKKATCFPGFEQHLLGARVSKKKVIVDGKIITAKGAGAAGDFGFKMVEVLRGKDVAKKLRNEMQY